MKIVISSEVMNAIAKNEPVVALESTIISHGMPYPENVSTALLVEQTIRNNGATPATIAFMHGLCYVGLTKEQLEEFAQIKDSVKISRRDIPVAIAKKLSGGTTVAATMIIAEHVGIRVFVTGGIGGVHRNAQQTFDISADLDELARTNVAVICAGAKAILDLPLTLEYLETKGVPVLGYKTDSLPAFYTKSSPYRVDYRVDSAEEFAQIMRAKWGLHIDGGILITNPVPDEYSMDYDIMQKYIDQALVEMNKAGIHGKESTPYLLDKIKNLSSGESLNTNIALVINNAKLGAAIAVSYYKKVGAK